MTPLIDIAPGVQISATVVARAAIEVASGTAGVVKLQPQLSTLASGITRRIGEVIAGRPPIGPADGVAVDVDSDGTVQVTLTLAIAGRQAAQLAAELLAEGPAAVARLCGVHPRLRIRITELIPRARPSVTAPAAAG